MPMTFTQDEIAAIIGAKELERIAELRGFQRFFSDVEAMRKRIQEIESALRQNPDGGVVNITPIKGPPA